MRAHRGPRRTGPIDPRPLHDQLWSPRGPHGGHRGDTAPDMVPNGSAERMAERSWPSAGHEMDARRSRLGGMCPACDREEGNNARCDAADSAPRVKVGGTVERMRVCEEGPTSIRPGAPPARPLEWAATQRWNAPARLDGARVCNGFGPSTGGGTPGLTGRSPPPLRSHPGGRRAARAARPKEWADRLCGGRRPHRWRGRIGGAWSGSRPSSGATAPSAWKRNRRATRGPPLISRGRHEPGRLIANFRTARRWGQGSTQFRNTRGEGPCRRPRERHPLAE